MWFSRDPAFLEYLDKIGQLFFGVPVPQRARPGGFLGNILGNFFNAMNDDDDDDEDQATTQPPSMARMFGARRPLAAATGTSTPSNNSARSSTGSSSSSSKPKPAKMETEEDLD